MTEIKVIELRPQNAMAIRERVPVDQIPTRMALSFAELMVHFQGRGDEISGPPFTLYHEFSKEGIDMEVGFPVLQPQEGAGRVIPCTLPGGRAVTATHVGPYDRIEATYHEVQSWMENNGLRPRPMMWEVYLSDPQVVKDPEQYVTVLYWPLE